MSNSKNTKPEKIIRSLLYKNGYRFRIHKKELPGKPDIVINKHKTIVTFMVVIGIITAAQIAMCLKQKLNIG